jgi:short-subunit dehydrogenase involved in D-alanine esterification of teichoic acids
MNTEKTKIVITGHTSGIGLALYNHFKDNYNCIGCSLSTGYDITNAEAREKIVKLTKDKDVCDLKGEINDYYIEIRD